MSKIIKRLGQIIKATNKSCLFVYFLLFFLIILCIFHQLILGYYDNIYSCLFSFLLISFLFIFPKYFNIYFSKALDISVSFFVFAAGILGEVYNFYVNIPSWDLILHIFSGFLCAGIGLSFINLFENNSSVQHFILSPLYVVIFSFCFSMTLSILWEFGEYAIDKMFLTDAQKDNILSDISSVSLDESKNDKPVIIKDIQKTILYDQNNQELVTINGGYLDIGLNDTMTDLLVNFIGAFIYSVLGFFYLKNKNKKNLAGKFIITKKIEKQRLI